jgi:hypothetical protein
MFNEKKEKEKVNIGKPRNFIKKSSFYNVENISSLGVGDK